MDGFRLSSLLGGPLALLADPFAADHADVLAADRRIAPDARSGWCCHAGGATPLRTPALRAQSRRPAHILLAAARQLDAGSAPALRLLEERRLDHLGDPPSRYWRCIGGHVYMDLR